MNLEIKDLVSIGALLLTSLTLLKGIVEYQKTQKWKKLEFIAKEVKEFFADFNVKRMLLLLDWNMLDLPIKEGEITTNAKTIKINDDILFSAWQHHEASDGFPELETLIRVIFDEGLSKLSLFNQYLKTGLMEENDLKPYLIYWIDIIGKAENGRKSSKHIEQLWEYINT